MAGSLAAHVALVTGGARGIGLASAHALAEMGAAIVVADLDLPAAEGVYPFVELTSPAALEHTFVTVCTAAPTTPAILPHGDLALAHMGDKWTITGRHAGQKVDVTLTYPAKGLPVITL